MSCKAALPPIGVQFTPQCGYKGSQNFSISKRKGQKKALYRQLCAVEGGGAGWLSNAFIPSNSMGFLIVANSP